MKRATADFNRKVPHVPRIRVIQIDAFTDRRFGGNAAAVCLVEEEQDPDWMQAVAAEMNLSGTAFIWPFDDGFELRFFTPAIEVDLSGHTTLASAHALWTEKIVTGGRPIHFSTNSGMLTCTTDDEFIHLDLPATPAQQVEPPAGLLDSLRVEPSFVGQTKFDIVVCVESERAVRRLNPDMAGLRRIPTRGVIVTGRSENPQFDFVSRFFAPRAGIDEDPVTGSAHCCLGPFWSQRLDKKEMMAFQASRRGGVIRVEVKGDRVLLGGQAVTVLRGELV